MQRIEVIVRKNDLSLARYLLAPGEYVLGRDADCELQIDCPDVSRHHARLTITADEFTVEDLGSTSGTLVAGEPIPKSASYKASKAIQIGGAMVHIKTLTEAELSALTVTVEPKPAPPPPPLSPAPVGPALPALAKGIQKPRNYEVGRELSHGGMGAVLEAQDLNINRAVAMKVILPAKAGSTTMLQRFIQEAQVLGRLEHPNIVPIHELGTDGEGRVFYTMKYVKGETLQRVLNQIKAGEAETIRKYPLSQLLTTFQKVCDAVGFAHSKGVVHRDLKPENIMLGEFGEVLVMDWGIAKILSGTGNLTVPSGNLPDETDGTTSTHPDAGPTAPTPVAPAGKLPAPPGSVHTLEGQLLGTPNFMAPEQAEGKIAEIDSRTDVFALGGILYCILTLEPPFNGSTVSEILEKATKCEIKAPVAFNLPGGPTALANFLPHCPNGRIPESLSAVAMKALARRPEDRYRNVRRLQKDIEAFQEGFPTSAEAPGLLAQFTFLLKRHRSEARAVGVAVLALAAALGVFAVQIVRSQSRIQSALTDLQKTAPVLEQLARAMVKEGRFEEALQKISSATVLAPGNPEFHCLKGNILQSLLRIEDAREAYATALKVRPGHAPAQTNLEVCDQMLRARSASGEWLPASLVELHQAMLRQQRIDEALGLLRRLRELRNDNQWLVGQWRETLIKAGWPVEGRLGFDAAGLHLNLEGMAVEDLSPLRGLPLTRIYFPMARVRDLDPLKGMLLSSLLLRGVSPDQMFIEDLKPLQGMPLKSLNLAFVKVSDLDPLSGMPLTHLNLEGMPVRSLAPLAGMPLTSLELWNLPEISDIAALKGLQLTNLVVHGSPISELAALEPMPLKHVTLANTKVSDLTPLRGKPLVRLNIGSSPVSDLSMIKDMPLEELNVDHIPVRLDFLSGMQLKILGIRGSGVTSLSPIKGMRLISLDAGENEFGDLSPLHGMPLTYLGLSANPVHDLAPLKGMKLTGLVLDRTRVTGLNSLSGMQLEWLHLNETGVQDLSPLQGLPLRDLRLSGCRSLIDLTPISTLKFLESLLIPTHFRDIEFLRLMPKLKTLGFSEFLPVAEFWKAYDARKKREQVE